MFLKFGDSSFRGSGFDVGVEGLGSRLCFLRFEVKRV